MDEDNGGPRKTSWTLLKRSHSNPHLLDERVLNEGSRRGSIRLVREAEFSRSAGHSPNHEPPFTSSSTWSLISDQTDVVMTSDRRPILKPIEPQDGLASPHSDTDDTYLSISMHPAQDLGMVVDESDEFTASLRPLLKYTEGDHLDLQGISSFLSSPDPNLQCAALQMLERAAEWESTNFTECMPVTFGPVSDLLNSQNLQVHCAALDTLKFFLASPHAADTIQSMITRVANAVFNDLSSSEPLVQMGSVELLEAAAQSEEILVEFTAAISHISSVLPSMPTATQVSALGVLEVSAGSNSHDLVKAVADTCQSFTQALFSPKTTVQIAVLEVLEAGLGTKSKELYHAVTAVLPVLANIISSGDPDVQTVARRVLEAGTRPVALNLWSTDSPLLPQPSALQHSQGQLPGQEYGLLSQATVRGAGALPGEFPHLYVERNHKLTRRGTQSPAPPGEVHGPLSQESVGVTGNTPTERTNTPFGQLSSGRVSYVRNLTFAYHAQLGLSFNTSGSVTYGLDVLPFHSFAPQYEDLEGPALYAPTVLYDYVQDSGIPDKVVSAPSAQVIDDVVPDNMRSQYVDPSKAESVIREVIYAQFENAPLRLLDTITGLLCDREAQISVFKASSEYKELLSFTMQHADLRLMMGRIKEVVETHFRCVMLSHRWEGKEPLPHDVRDRAVYGLKAVGSITKLQSFCRVARDAGYRWAWMDTCCIDQTNNVEVQESVNSMFVWYRHSALTIVYLSDVPPSSKSGALARSAWNSRGWTVQEFLAPKVVLFYQEDWTLYLGDCSSNHKDSVTIMRELGDATGIDARSLVAFHPGMKGAREKLRWVSTRITTLQEDIAYSLFGIFDVHLPVIYGEKKQNALGRLLQEVVARSGDISVLDWVGKSSNFNSCLPADITLYKAPACTLPSSSEDEMQASASSLRDAGAAKWASRLYHTLNTLRAPRFAHCRLHLPCIAFLVTDVRRKRGQDLEMNYTYKVKADGLHDLVITTEDRLPQFSQTRPTRPAFLIVRPWDRSLLKLPDFADLTDVSDAESIEDWSPSVSPVHDSPGEPFGGNQHIDSESHSQALRLIVRLGQRFSAFFLAQQWGGEYKRIASDHDIVAQVKDIASVHDMMNLYPDNYCIDLATAVSHADRENLLKLQFFCKFARDVGCRLAWSDTCCIDKSNHAEVQQSLNSMFVWYRHSALTIVYLSDVLPSSKPGALAKSEWNTRGWTVGEFLAPKESVEITQEFEDVLGIDAQALAVSFQPGMKDAREKLRWASTRFTTMQEDIAYSLFGIFSVHLTVNYGEKKQNALGRLLQEIVARSGDHSIGALDWVGKSSEFNSCLPAEIISYEAPPYAPPLLSEEEMQTAVSSLRNTVTVELASKLYIQLDDMSAPRFANCRLHLPCIAFHVTEVRRRHSTRDQEAYVTYEVKADGFRDLLVTTEGTLPQFSPARRIRQTFLLVRPWNRDLLELPDFADDTETDEGQFVPESPVHDSVSRLSEENEVIDSESHSRALRLLVRLGQPFCAFLLAQQHHGEYKRIAPEQDIIAQVKDMASVQDLMDVRTLEIL
ncbi:hypothetical protein M405DRAFT_885991 [Rhizopogon salebrosus TDB-379]|nr:hypothetical protein M405DRAFT_885991 [Rhizopogon salebrosus TDB-379]